MNENCCSEIDCDVIELTDPIDLQHNKLEEYFDIYKNDEFLNNEYKFTFYSLIIYGTITQHETINIENKIVQEYIDRLFKVYMCYFEDNDINLSFYEEWCKTYKSIVNSDTDVTAEFIDSTLTISDKLFQKDKDNYFIYWNFIFIIACLFPKEIYHELLIEKINSIPFSRLFESYSFNHKFVTTIAALINDNSNFKTKCMGVLRSIRTSNETPETSIYWNKYVPQYFAATIIYVILKITDPDLEELVFMYKNTLM